MKHIEVVAAIIKNDNKILCVQRKESSLSYISKKYEFPGGKMEFNETKVDTIVREIKEELSMDIIVKEEFLTVSHQYPDFLLTMHSFICTCNERNLVLNEHIDYKWLETDELEKLDWAAADIPIVNKLIAN
jgi:8-oxo-dGTP diphosphatase